MDFRQRLEQQKGSLPAPEPDDSDQPLYFAMGRGYIPVCLELRLPDGSREAFPYATFSALAYAADTGIEIFTAKNHILITGRELLPLYDRLLTYRLRYIQSAVGRDTQDDGLYISTILIDQL